MIEVTNEMVQAFAEAYGEADDGSPKTILGGLAEKAGIAAVLAIVEHDWTMRPRRSVIAPRPASLYDPIVDPCGGCGCAKDLHGPNGCTGDFAHCRCETWTLLPPCPRGWPASKAHPGLRDGPCGHIGCCDMPGPDTAPNAGGEQ